MPENALFHKKMLAMNEALTIGLVRQTELTDFADLVNAQLQAEIAERKLATAALRESEERYRVLFELGPVAVYSCDASGLIRSFNPRAAELWGRSPAIGDDNQRFCGSLRMFNPDDTPIAHDECAMADVLSGKVSAAHDVEVHIERPDNSRVVVIADIRPLKNERGEITGAINCFYDITGRKKAEERQLFLVNELAHRGQNLLAVIKSIAALSLRGDRPLAEECGALQNRILALARSQRALVEGGFAGASVAEIIRLEFDGFSNRVTAAGPDVMLNRRVTQTFSLVVHELATNATKHGALSSPGGEVAINWSLEGAGADARFKFRWRELGGPPVASPTRKGFGSVLLEKAAAQDFEVEPTITFAPDGLCYEIDARLSVITAGADADLLSRHPATT